MRTTRDGDGDDWVLANEQRRDTRAFRGREKKSGPKDIEESKDHRRKAFQ
ncbi:MAG: hypothetical protein ACQPRI_06300 [Solitalea-like symbiont of Tyrophagus putrescentiae]